jgi:hypothetical protein
MMLENEGTGTLPKLPPSPLDRRKSGSVSYDLDPQSHTVSPA